MARQKGMLNLSGNLEPLAGAPLDSRDITPTVADLYVASNWPYKYIGMKTTVTATGDTYRLVNLDVTQESSWVKEGSGGSGASSLSDLEDVDLINPEEGETLIYDGEGGWTNGPAGQTYSDFTGATSQAAGAHGLVPAPTTGDISKFLKGDGTWATVPMPSFDYSNTSPEAMNFSTDEKVIGTWIDGKPLYQKTVNCGALPNATTKNVPHGISNLEYIVDVFGVSLAVNDGFSKPLPLVYQADAANYNVGISVSSTNIELVDTTNRSQYSKTYVTLRYTKTTDTAVASGEKIVGTWIDGRPVYEKTWDFGSNVEISSENYYTGFNIDSSNMDKILSGKIMNNDGTLYNDVKYDPTRNNHTLLGIKPDNPCNVRYLTIRYTKTT